MSQEEILSSCQKNDNFSNEEQGTEKVTSALSGRIKVNSVKN